MHGNKKTLVSILCPSYNHEKYVAKFIESVLAQTNPNWELIIVDDASTDSNVDVIKQYADSRICLLRHDFNRGINSAINTARAAAHGDVLCLMASDDIMMVDYVQVIHDMMQTNPGIGVIYTDLQYIDNSGRVLKKNILRQPRLDKNSLIQQMFFRNNCLWSPGMAISRRVFDKIYPLDIPMSIYQDYKINVLLLLLTDMGVAPRPLIFYRMPSKKSGISYLAQRNSVKCDLEENNLMDAFLNIKNPTSLMDIFKNVPGPWLRYLDDRTVPFVLGMLAMQSNNFYKQLWGYNQICKFIEQPENYVHINKKYGFNYKDFLRLSERFHPDVEIAKYLKYKNLFNLCLVLLFICLIRIFLF